MNNKKKTLVNLYRQIVSVTRLRIFCTTLFTQNNIKVVIQMHSFQFDPLLKLLTPHLPNQLKLRMLYRNNAF